MNPLICFNKIDMLKNRLEVDSITAVYQKIGYRTILTRVQRLAKGIKEFESVDEREDFGSYAGLSGVGKSSLLNAIQPNLKLKTNEVNPKRGGRHTTVATQLYNLDFGGFIADTPGLRELNFWDIEPHLMDRYFPEINSRRERCAKSFCTHIYEESCSVEEAMKRRGHFTVSV